MPHKELKNDEQIHIERVSIIVDPADSRPVTAWALDTFNQTGEIFFSPGTAVDMLLLKWWLDFIGNAAADEYFERKKQEDLRDDIIDGTSSVDTDSVPF